VNLLERGQDDLASLLFLQPGLISLRLSLAVLSALLSSAMSRQPNRGFNPNSGYANLDIGGPPSPRYAHPGQSEPSPFAQLSQLQSPTSPRHGTNAAALAAAATPLAGAPVFTARDAELDDKLHNPSPHDSASWTAFSLRGCLNMGALVIMVVGLVTLFAGYPILQYFNKKTLSNFGAYGVGGTNSTGQVPKIPGLPTLIDEHTPDSALTRTGFDGKKYVLMFSDEFEVDGRTFWPGDDPCA
jgi:hypothetical protein